MGATGCYMLAFIKRSLQIKIKLQNVIMKLKRICLDVNMVTGKCAKYQRIQIFGPKKQNITINNSFTIYCQYKKQ